MSWLSKERNANKRRDYKPFVWNKKRPWPSPKQSSYKEEHLGLSREQLFELPAEEPSQRVRVYQQPAKWYKASRAFYLRTGISRTKLNPSPAEFPMRKERKEEKLDSPVAETSNPADKLDSVLNSWRVESLFQTRLKSLTTVREIITRGGQHLRTWPRMLTSWHS